MEPTWTWDTARAAGVLSDEWLDLTDADLYGAHLRYANLRYANLRCADLRDADLYGADLRSADLRGADLRDANLRDADLHGADLRSADLRGANLRCADLRDADLHGADLRSAHIDFSCWPLWCGSLEVQVDKRIAVQLMYHACALNCDDSEYLELRNACLDFANQMYRDDVPRLELKKVETERETNGTGNEEEDHVG